jgi:hypothetical protein
VSDTDELALKKSAEAERFIQQMDLHRAMDWRTAAQMLRQAADLYQQRYNEMILEAVGEWCEYYNMVRRDGSEPAGEA